MEGPVEAAMADATAADGVVGIMCIDENGLLISAKGDIEARKVGHVANLEKSAASLEPTSARPIVCIEADGYNLLVKREDGLFTTFFFIPCYTILRRVGRLSYALISGECFSVNW